MTEVEVRPVKGKTGPEDRAQHDHHQSQTLPRKRTNEFAI